jgi:hypothetical protein
MKNPGYRALMNKKNDDGTTLNKMEKKTSTFRDVLKDSSLPSNVVVRDVIRHLSDTSDLGADIVSQIPNRTRECFLEYLVTNQLPGLTESQEFMRSSLNEINQLLFVSLKLSIQSFYGRKMPQKWLIIDNLDDFMKYDVD